MSNVAASKSVDFDIYTLSSDGKGVITWSGYPHGPLKLDPSKAKPGEWLIVNNGGDEPAMAYKFDNEEDSILELWLDEGSRTACTLFHSEDDYPDRVYYFATDMGNDERNILRRPAFILRALGRKNSPIGTWKSFHVLCFDRTLSPPL